MKFGTSITPELPVVDVRRAQQYYRDVLGFEIAWIWNDDYGAVYNGNVEIFLTKAEGAPPSMTCYMRVENADDVYATYLSAGAKIVEEIGSRPWGMREFVIEDLDGHRIRIGHGEKSIHEIDEFSTIEEA